MSCRVCRNRSSIFLMSLEKRPIVVVLVVRGVYGNRAGPCAARLFCQRVATRSVPLRSRLAGRRRNRATGREIVAQIAAEHAAERRASGAKQKRYEGPERQVGGRFARRISCLRH